MWLQKVFCGYLLVGTSAIEIHAAGSKQKPIVVKTASVDHSFLGKQDLAHNASFALATPPNCKCMGSNPAWVKTTRTVPKCIFIDLGAADGNTFRHFINNGYGPVKDCGSGSGDFEAWLVEANPRFNDPLNAMQTQYPGKVHSLASTAAYMCEGQTSFFLDTTNHNVNYWGSSMGKNHPDAIKSGHQKVTVPTTNLIKMLYENTIPGDWVMVKMDIEGAEWDIMPCLADSPVSHIIDRFYLEQHPAEWSSTEPTPAGSTIEEAKAKLKAKGVDIPGYFSNTF